MRAARYDRTGPAAAVLRVLDIERPEPGPGQVRVRVRTSGVNPTDVKARSGAVPRPIDGFQIPHHDGTGVIDAVGPDIDASRIGQHVWLWFAATRRWGTCAQWTVIPEHQAVPMPANVSDELGACLGVPAMTAHRCLFADGPLDGKTVLVAGGAGAVGHFAIQLARHAGAVVVATVSSPEKAELATAAGAHHVVNYRQDGAAETIRSLVPKVDRVVEVALGANLGLDLSLAHPGTVIVCYASTGGDPVLPVRACMSANVALRFVLLYGVPPESLALAAKEVSGALADGALSPLPIHRFSLDEVVAAHELVEAGVTGKVVVEPT